MTCLPTPVVSHYRRLLVCLTALAVVLLTSAEPRSSDAVDFAVSQIGKPYALGATGPNAFDCSGLIQSAYAQVGVQLPRTARQQSEISFGQRVTSDFKRGDLLFYGTDDNEPDAVSHVGIYVGNNRWISAQTPLPQPNGEVLESDTTNPYWAPRFVFGVRIGVAAPPIPTPVATADTYAMTQGTTLTVPARGVLANDTVPDNYLSVTYLNVPTGFADLGSGGFSLTPSPDFSGTVQFAYSIHTSAVDSATATVTVQVSPVPVPVGTPIRLPVSISPDGTVKFNCPPGYDIIGFESYQGTYPDTSTHTSIISVDRAYSCSGLGGNGYSMEGVYLDWTAPIPDGDYWVRISKEWTQYGSTDFTREWYYWTARREGGVWKLISGVSNTSSIDTLSAPFGCSSSQSGNFQGYQYLGQGLTGRLSEVDLKILTPPPTYYGKSAGVQIRESDTYLSSWTDIRTFATVVWSRGEAPIGSSNRIGISSYDGIVRFANPELGGAYDFQPSKYYYLVPLFFTSDGGGICQNSYFYGSLNGTAYRFGAFFGDQYVKDLYFDLQGLSFAGTPSVLPAEVIYWQSNSSTLSASTPSVDSPVFQGIAGGAGAVTWRIQDFERTGVLEMAMYVRDLTAGKDYLCEGDGTGTYGYAVRVNGGDIDLTFDCRRAALHGDIVNNGLSFQGLPSVALDPTHTYTLSLFRNLGVGPFKYYGSSSGEPYVLFKGADLFFQANSSGVTAPHPGNYWIETLIHDASDGTWNVKKVAIAVDGDFYNGWGVAGLTENICKTLDLSFPTHGGAWNGTQNNISNPWGVPWQGVTVTADPVAGTCTFENPNGLVTLANGTAYDLAYSSHSASGQYLWPRGLPSGPTLHGGGFGYFTYGNNAAPTLSSEIVQGAIVVCTDTSCNPVFKR